MAEIRAFRASRFTAEAGPLSKLIAPPSETLSPEDRERYAVEPNNIVHATMPAADSDDRSKYVRYARASAQLSGLRRNKLLASDAVPALYRLILEREGNLTMGLVALTPVTGLHRNESEPVTVKAREDRLRLLEATRMHLEPVTVQADALDLTPLLQGIRVAELAEAVLSDGRSLSLDAITDPEVRAVLTEAFTSISLTPVAGLATIEAALAFRAALGERPGAVAEDYVPVVISSSGTEIPSGLLLWSLGEFA